MTPKMPRGAWPTPRSELAASKPYRDTAGSELFGPSSEFPSPNHELAAAPPYQCGAARESFLAWPIGFDFSENEGSSLWAEEVFAKACAEPRVIIPTDVALRAERECGSSNFARFMQIHGFRIGDKAYLDGPFHSVNWTDTGTLASAIDNHGPIKIGIASGGLHANTHGFVTPATSGWAIYGYPKNQIADRCASLCGYGNLNALVGLFQAHGAHVSIPPGMPTGLCYAMFTMNSIGIIDRQSMLNMTGEAWVRVPVTTIKALDA